MEKVVNKDIIKVPNYVICSFCPDRNFLLVEGKLGVKLLKLQSKIDLLIQKREIWVTKDVVCFRNDRNIRKEVLQSATKSLIKKAFFDVSRKSFKKLKLVGVGFRIALVEVNEIKLLKLNIGYSHSVYYRIPLDISINVISSTRFIVIGTSSDRVSKVASGIRQLKVPESYKGKGILYEDEEIILKEVKKS